MKAEFNLKRELKNELVFGHTKGPGTYIHFHSHIELYFILSGEVEVFLNEQRRILKRGEGIIAKSYDAHGYRHINDSEAFYIIIPRNWCADILQSVDDKCNNSQFISNERVFEVIAREIEHLSGKQNEVSVRGRIYVILGAILDELVPMGDMKEGKDTFSPEILMYISERYKEDISLASLAKKFGYNPSYLSRSFKSNFGLPFCKYITMLRLREAVKLITQGESSITKCAIDSGFGSMRSFYRAFFEEFAMSPKEYLRKKM